MSYFDVVVVVVNIPFIVDVVVNTSYIPSNTFTPIDERVLKRIKYYLRS